MTMTRAEIAEGMRARSPHIHTSYSNLLGIEMRAARDAALRNGHAARPLAVYLAARYALWPDMQRHRADLEGIGIHVTSHWVNGLDTPNNAVFGTYAQTAMDDIDAADFFVTFTEDPQRPIGGQTNGGRHWECGYAMAKHKRIIVVGYHENVFHYLPEVEFYSMWDECLKAISVEPGRRSTPPETPATASTGE